MYAHLNIEIYRKRLSELTAVLIVPLVEDWNPVIQNTEHARKYFPAYSKKEKICSISMANENKYSTIDPIYIQLSEYSDYYNIKWSEWNFFFSLLLCKTAFKLFQSQTLSLII